MIDHPIVDEGGEIGKIEGPADFVGPRFNGGDNRDGGVLLPERIFFLDIDLEPIQFGHRIQRGTIGI
ncbi:MAG: hypothetical protein E4H29_07660 [Deltaproteobacteria bacterium]|nr:MAG: hypothetical protein E4H29_07660 [Deltaproteobacteria bacterium]